MASSAIRPSTAGAPCRRAGPEPRLRQGGYGRGERRFGRPGSAWARRMGQGLDTTRRGPARHGGDPYGKPALVVHGRDDTRVPLDHGSRPHLGSTPPPSTAGARCPTRPSQVVTDRAARGEHGHAPALTRADVPPGPAAPAPGDRTSCGPARFGCPAENRPVP
ncbi:D-(-)-3-hydroxybutyrate oligomer hydrolase [Streptomyces caelestis]